MVITVIRHTLQDNKNLCLASVLSINITEE